MIELFILALASITIMDVSFDNGMHVDGVAEPNAKIELHVTYSVREETFSSPYIGKPCENKGLPCTYFIDKDKLLTTTNTDNHGSFTIKSTNYQVEQLQSPLAKKTTYYISMNNQQEYTGPLYYGIRDVVKSYASGIGTHAEIENTLLVFLNKRDALRTTDYSITEIPEWFRNTAGYWADKQITNADFLNAINYLVNKKIIEIHN